MQCGFVKVGGVRLEAGHVGADPEKAPTLLLLHEGLGSVEMWRDFPGRLVEGLPDHAVIAYSRAGYGRSDPVTLPRPLDYMQREAEDVVPGVIDASGAREVILVGHSDGASIAAWYAGKVPDDRIKGVVLMSPHFFNEEVCVESIQAAREAYETTDFREKLKRFHGDNVDCAFRGWNDAWLDPGFWTWNIEEALPGISAPTLILQGDQDPYGTLAHVRAAEAHMTAPLKTVIIEGVGHTPFREAADRTDAEVIEFVSGLSA